MNRCAGLADFWAVKSLGEMSSAIQYGFTAKARDERVGPRLLRITDIQNNAVIWSDVPYCEIGEEDKAKYLLRENDLVFARTGATVGKSYLIRGVIPESVFASYLIRVRLKDDVEPRYVAHFFQSAEYWRQVGASRSGIGQPNVNGKKLAQIQIPIAPLEQQRRIVAEIEKQFSRLDEAVANLKRVKANLKRYRAAVLKAAVEGRLVPTEAELARREGRTYETGEQLLARILAERRAEWEKRAASSRKKKYIDPQPLETSNLPKLSEGWTWAKVDQVGRLQLGRQRAPKYHQGQNMRPYLRVQNVFEAKIDLADVMEMDFPGDDFESFMLKPGDILLNEGQSPELLGRPAIYRGEVSGACFTNTLIRFQAVGPLRVEFALAVFRHYMRAGRFTAEATITTNIAHLSLGRLKTIEFPVPPHTEQQRIAGEIERHLSIVDSMEAEVEQSLARAKRLRSAILSASFGQTEG